MNDDRSHRRGVGVMLLNRDGQVFVGARVDNPEDAWQMPQGGIDDDEEPWPAAIRELEEETGYRAASWRLLGRFWTAPGFATEVMHLYLATELTAAGEDRLVPEADERLHLVRLPWREAVAAAERGEIADAKSIVGLFWLARIRGA